MQHTKPSDIEKMSIQTITQELSAAGIIITEENDAVVKRVIHATADFDFAKNLVFTDNAVEYGVKALQSHTPIITDTNMALAGVSKPLYGGSGNSCRGESKWNNTSCLRDGICC